MKFNTLRVGLTGVAQVVVGVRMPPIICPDMVPAFATPMLLSLMDNAAHEAVKITFLRVMLAWEHV